MATDLQPGEPGGALAEKPKVFGLFSMVLFSVSAILVADTVGGGTIASLLIGWGLYRHSTRRSGGAASAAVSDVQ